MPADSMQHRDYGSDRPGLGYGVALGLVATGSGLAAAEVVVGLVEGSASPVVPVGQVFIDWVPKPLKDWAIEQFGTNDKVVLVTGALIVVLALGVTVGILAIRGQRAGAYALTVGDRCARGGGGDDPPGSQLRQAAADDRRHDRFTRVCSGGSAPDGQRSMTTGSPGSNRWTGDGS